MYRADPYFYKRPWMDWCSSQWNLSNESDNNDLLQEFPCRIFMFIDTRNMTFDKDITEKGRYLAIVKSSEIDKRSDRLRRNKDCFLFNIFKAKVSTKKGAQNINGRGLKWH